jgi:hypothetical protein
MFAQHVGEHRRAASTRADDKCGDAHSLHSWSWSHQANKGLKMYAWNKAMSMDAMVTIQLFSLFILETEFSASHSV